VSGMSWLGTLVLWVLALGIVKAPCVIWSQILGLAPKGPRPRFFGRTSHEVAVPCRLWPLRTLQVLFLGWFALTIGFWPLNRLTPWNFLAFGLALLLDAALQTWLRYLFAVLLVDLFELDEALAPAASKLYGDREEPSRAAYDAAVMASYHYIGTLTWGDSPCQWGFSFRARFADLGGKTGWHIPEYPWLTHLGGPALLEVDSEILLVMEKLTDPRPHPVLPGPYFVEPRCAIGERRDPYALPLSWPDPAQGEVELETRTAEALEATAPPFDETETESPWAEAWLRSFNSELPKFGRVRYPVLFGLRAHTARKASIFVRTRDGLPLRITNVSVAYELFHEGWLIREARHRLAPAKWHQLVWKATLQLMQREASHWEIHSATALATYVIQGALEAAFRKVFSRYTAAQLLDRVQKTTLEEILRSWPPEARQRIEGQIREFLERPGPVSWEQIHDEVLRELNGSAEEGYPLAEQRGLFVTQLSFDDWRAPGVVRELHRQAMRAMLAWEEEDLPSRVYIRQQRVSASEGQRLADMLTAELPALDYPTPPWSALASAETRVLQVRQAWFRVLEALLEEVRWHPHVRHLFAAAAFGADVDVSESAAYHDDAALVAWILQAQNVLAAHPYGGRESMAGPAPEEFLGE